MRVLVLQPIRPDHPPALRARADALLAQLESANPGMSFDIRQDDAKLEIPEHPSLYMKHATVRNYMLDAYLRDDHAAVLWVDSDLVEYDADLPTQLNQAAERLRKICPQCKADITVDLYPGARDCAECGHAWMDVGAIVAPLALLSETSGYPERFYDIGGFIENGNRARMQPPYFDQQGEVIELDSVGCCYLAPAQLYRDGVRYAPPPTDYYVEHWSVMRQAAKRGYRVACLTTARVVHAWLPDYGLKAN